MKRRLFILLVLLLGALLQQVLQPLAPVGGMKPPILISIALYFSLRRNTDGWWFAVFAAAVLHDALDIGSFGPALLSYPLICYTAHRFRNELFVDGIVTQMALGGLAGFITTFTALMLYTITGQRPFHFGMALLRLFGSFWLGLATLPAMAHLLPRLEKILPKRRSYGWQ